MKSGIILITGLFLLSGCGMRTQSIQLKQLNQRQALIIQQQQAQINALNEKLNTIKQKKLHVKTRKKAKVTQATTLPTPPKKHIKLKKVEDRNYTSGYMYPGAPTEKTKQVATTPQKNVATTMGKTECIGMIGQAKFDKYTQMFGSEAASLKRCKMLKAMK